MIFFNGKSSDDLRVVVETYPERPIPKRKTERWSVPGRSGDVISAAECWENVKMGYDVYLSAEKIRLPAAANKVIAWLSAPGYHALADDYDADCFRMATYDGDASIQNYENMFGRFRIEFDCWPQRFLTSGAEAVSVAQGGVLVNPSIYPAEPLIVVQGSGSGTLTVNGMSLSLSDCNGVTLDCRDRECWRGVSNLNSGVSGSWPRLTAGENSIQWSGGITAVRVTPRWWVL